MKKSGIAHVFLILFLVLNCISINANDLFMDNTDNIKSESFFSELLCVSKIHYHDPKAASPFMLTVYDGEGSADLIERMKDGGDLSGGVSDGFAFDPAVNCIAALELQLCSTDFVNMSFGGLRIEDGSIIIEMYTTLKDDDIPGFTEDQLTATYYISVPKDILSSLDGHSALYFLCTDEDGELLQIENSFYDKINKGVLSFPGSVDLFDVNGDGEIGAADLTRLMRVIAGDATEAYHPDVNLDDTVDTKDLTRLMKHLAE